MIKTATTTDGNTKTITANFISIPSNTDLRVAFFLSPRTHDLVYPSGVVARYRLILTMFG